MKQCSEQYMKEKKMQQTILDALSIHVIKIVNNSTIYTLPSSANNSSVLYLYVLEGFLFYFYVLTKS